MARTDRPGLSHEQKDELWRRWKAGETLSDIGRALGKHAASVFGVVAAKGGFAPMSFIYPLPRLCCTNRLTGGLPILLGRSIPRPL